MNDPRSRASTEDPERYVPEADRLEQQSAIDDVPDRSPEADEADQLEQAATLADEEDYPHGGRD